MLEICQYIPALKKRSRLASEQKSSLISVSFSISLDKAAGMLIFLMNPKFSSSLYAIQPPKLPAVKTPGAFWQRRVLRQARPLLAFMNSTAMGRHDSTMIARMTSEKLSLTAVRLPKKYPAPMKRKFQRIPPATL